MTVIMLETARTRFRSDFSHNDAGEQIHNYSRRIRIGRYELELSLSANNDEDDAGTVSATNTATAKAGASPGP